MAERRGNRVADADGSDGNELVWTFAYGSNMLDEVITTVRGVHPRQTFVGRVWGHEFSLSYRGFPLMEPAFATIAEAPWNDVCVYGALYQITRKEMNMIIQSEGQAYCVVHVTVDVLGDSPESGFRQTACCLSAVPEKRLRAPAPWSARYKNLVVRGAKSLHLPDEYVAFLEAIPHYTRPRVDYVLLFLLFPILFSLRGTWLVLSALRPRLPRSVSGTIFSAFLTLTTFVTPFLWAVHDLVPDRWRGFGTDAASMEAALPAGHPGEWYSSRHRQRAMGGGANGLSC